MIWKIKFQKILKMWTGDLKIVENYINSNNLIKILGGK